MHIGANHEQRPSRDTTPPFKQASSLMRKGEITTFDSGYPACPGIAHKSHLLCPEHCQIRRYPYSTIGGQVVARSSIGPGTIDVDCDRIVGHPICHRSPTPPGRLLRQVSAVPFADRAEGP